jgi:hypothetical protein
LRAEREDPSPPDKAVECVNESEEARLMIPHRAADVP